jgi:nitrate/nitrite transport system substrate-binding protein
MIAPFTLARQGSVFMAAKTFGGALTMDPKTWKTAIEAQRAKGGDPFTIALPWPYGWHGLMYRYMLANAGIHCDRDLKLITLPPAQMVQNIRVGTMQACAMVEPWGARGVAEGATTIVMYGHEMWRNHPIKSFGMLERFAEQNPKTVRAMLRGLHESAQWCDNPANHEELARILATPSYMNSPAPTILAPVRGQFDWGNGRKETNPDAGIKYNRDNYPQPAEVKWFLTQFRRWGMLTGTPEYEAIAKRVGRPEIYQEAMKELGFSGFKVNNEPVKFWDGTVYDHTKSEAYAKSFAVHSLKG